MAVRFEPLRLSLFAPDWDSLRSVASAALKADGCQWCRAERVRLCGHVNVQLQPPFFAHTPELEFPKAAYFAAIGIDMLGNISGDYREFPLFRAAKHTA